MIAKKAIEERRLKDKALQQA